MTLQIATRRALRFRFALGRPRSGFAGLADTHGPRIRIDDGRGSEITSIVHFDGETSETLRSVTFAARRLAARAAAQ